MVLGLSTFLLDKKTQTSMLAWGDLPLWVLGLALVVLYLTGGRFLGSLENRLVHVANNAQLRAIIDDVEIELTALVDSGNQLVEPLSGRPVVVVALSAISDLLPPEIVALSCSESIWEAKLDALAASNFVHRLHFVPFHAVANDSGVLLGVRVDYLEITCNGRTQKASGITLAISPVDLSADDNYQALVPLRLLPTKAAGRAA
jgi:stage II sporulation protein GA (sporulation sigma-E factor processing peptidase)